MIKFSHLLESLSTDFFTVRGYKCYYNSGNVYINDTHIGKADSLREARQICNDTILVESIQDSYLSDNTIIESISYHRPDIRITNRLLEQYRDTIEQKIFTLDPIVLDILETFNQDCSISERFDFMLEDGSHVIISKELLDKLNILNREEIQKMSESIESFIEIVEEVF